MPKAKLTVMEQIEEVKRQTLVYECAKSFEAWAAGVNARMLAGDPSMQGGAVYSTTAEPEGQQPKTVTPIIVEAIPRFKLPLTVIDETAHQDILERLKTEG